jgi:phosphatidylinositol alpha-mannosyltransferase
MRVALVCPYAIDRPGGVQGQVLGLAGALGRRGHTVTVLAPAIGGRGALRGQAAGGPRVVVVGPAVEVPANGSVAPIALSPAVGARVARALRAERPDVVHVHEPLAPVVGWAGVLGAGPGAPSIGTVHRAGGAGLYRVLGVPASWLLGRCGQVVAVSDEARATAVPALAGRPCPVVGNGVDLERLQAVAPEPTTGPTVLFVGRHEARKGLGVLLAATDELGSTWPGRLWIVGHGPETAALRARWPETPTRRWWGRVADDRLAALLAGADVLCAPSLGGESFGVVLVEALASRCVVVASALPGYQAVLGPHGVLVPPGDAHALAQALAAVVEDVAGRRGWAAPERLDAAASAAARWSMDSLADRYLELYRALPEGLGPGS